MTSRFSSSAASALLFLAACSTPDAIDDTVAMQAPVEVVRSTMIPATRSVAGTVRSRTVSPVSARVAGNVTRVLVSIGDRVRTGQLLVEIDDRDGRAGAARAASGRDELEQAIASAAAAVESARANATLAAATFQRFSALRGRGSASVQEFDDARARDDVAQSELERAQRSHGALLARRGESAAVVTQAATFLGHSSVRSPIDGIVTARFVDPGAQAAPGVPLVTIEDASSFRVDATVDEAVPVRAGDSVVVKSGAESVTARVARVRPAVDAVTRSALVEIDLPAPLRSGSFVKVLFTTGERAAITVPATAVSRRGQLTSVLAVGDDGVARMRLISLGETTGQRTEVLAGLDAGETIVPVRVPGLREGVRVRSAL
ncbi:MAG TPA: efflux RND transporter periplasmic adaptor subunit [Thermoanaerobaculia bacterium]|nr:efflux RND transporter periplasmic adaptor subunit [Thermoanaerobaculia bacterium]